MTTQTVKNQIKKKFGTVAKFAKLADLDYYDLQKIFYSGDPDKLFEVSKKIMSIEVEPTDGEINDVQREKLKAKMDKAGGVIAFCRDNPKYSRVTIFQILSGHRKRLAPKVVELFTELKIKMYDH